MKHKHGDRSRVKNIVDEYIFRFVIRIRDSVPDPVVLLRAREEYAVDSATFSENPTRQDAAILNIQRACEAALDMGQHLIRRERLGIPQSARDVFTLLAQAGWIDLVLAAKLKRMVGFRNIAVHEYQALQLSITVAVIENHLDEFLQYSKAVLLKDAAHSRQQK